MAYPVSKSQFAQFVELALAQLPDEFAKALEEMRVEVVDDATEGQRLAGKVKRNGLLLGLYVGRPLTQRSVWDSGAMPDVIYLFQRAIEAVCNNSDEVIQQVRITVLHEIGHHFGMSEVDLERLGYG